MFALSAKNQHGSGSQLYPKKNIVSVKNVRKYYKYMSALQEKFEKEIKPGLLKSLGKTNVHAIPALDKITVNMGIGRFKGDKAGRRKHLGGR